VSVRLCASCYAEAGCDTLKVMKAPFIEKKKEVAANAGFIFAGTEA
jgi:hypothetical protein